MNGQHPWPHADREMSRLATALLGRQCYVCPGYNPQTMELNIMVADGVNVPVVVSLPEEIQAAVAELDANLGGGINW